MAKKAVEAEQEALEPDEEALTELEHEAAPKPEDAAAPQAEDDKGDDKDAPDLQAALDAARDEAASLKDAALRAQAEVENMRRRTARDVENAHKFALERFAESLLPVVDSLEKSVESLQLASERQAANAEGTTGQPAEAADAATVSEGVGLCLKLFLDTLAKHGIEQLDPLGEPFDPARSEAMAMVENPDAEPNSVVEVMQKGYALNGRLVRAAKVIVAKAPAAAPAG